MTRFSCCGSNRNRIPSFFLAITLIATFVAGCFFVGIPESTADLKAPGPQEHRVSIIINDLLQRDHLLKKRLDDEVSQRAIKSFLKSLDPMKVYFYQSDIDEFMSEKNNLDDFVRKGDLKFAWKVFNRLLKRIDERVEVVDELLAIKHDFTVKESMVTDRDALTYSTTKEEAYERWRKRIKYDLLVLKSEKTEGDEAVDRLTRRYHGYSKRMNQFKADTLLEMFLSAFSSSLDPHTSYMSPSSLNDFRISMRLNLEGIGAALSPVDGYTVVSQIIQGGAAEKDGKLKPEDRIVSVGQGSDGEMVDVVDMNLRDVVKLIRGKSGTLVRLGVRPAGKNEVEIYTIERARVELKESEARGEIIEDTKLGTHADGTAIKIGVIDLPSFYMDMEAARLGLRNFKSTTRDVRRILRDFNDKGVDVVMLNLRHNGGGSLTEAINLTGLFIDRGPVVQVKDSRGRVQAYDDTVAGTSWSGPLVVLISKFSASASEILAGAIQDYDRGIIVGDVASHGKGTVQSLMDVGERLYPTLRRNQPNLGALKITIQQFYRPAGDSTQKRGVLSDVVLPSLTTHMDVGESDLDFPVEFDQVPSARIVKTNFRNPNLIKELTENSRIRRENLKDFEKLEKDIERYKGQKAKKMVTLNEEEFFAERADLDADKEEEKSFKEQSGNNNRPVVKRDFYMDEVLTIAAEYSKKLSETRVAGVQ